MEKCIKAEEAPSYCIKYEGVHLLNRQKNVEVYMVYEKSAKNNNRSQQFVYIHELNLGHRRLLRIASSLHL